MPVGPIRLNREKTPLLTHGVVHPGFEDFNCAPTAFQIGALIVRSNNLNDCSWKNNTILRLHSVQIWASYSSTRSDVITVVTSDFSV